MIKILFVCWGNICRSPMAEFVFKDIVTKQKIADRFLVKSAAISSEEIRYNGEGNPVYPPAARELKKHGISCSGKTAVQIVKADYDNYDYIVAMEQRHIPMMERVFGGDPDKKLSKLLDFTADPNRDIADPWYYGNFDQTYEEIYEGCIGLLDMALR